jgi:predicted aconitase with swiveling domain
MAIVTARVLIAGEASGEVLAADEPLSFWGGYDSRQGEIIDQRHPLAGKIAAGRILVLPASRGSSTTTAVLLESVRAGTAPAAILCKGADLFLSLASVVADEMYGKPIPLFSLSGEDFQLALSARHATVHASGQIELEID